LSDTGTSGQRRSEILKWITTIEYKKHHQNAKEGLLEDTGQWLFCKEEFVKWRASSASTILWLHGIRELTVDNFDDRTIR